MQYVSARLLVGRSNREWCIVLCMKDEGYVKSKFWQTIYRVGFRKTHQLDTITSNVVFLICLISFDPYFRIKRSPGHTHWHMSSSMKSTHLSTTYMFHRLAHIHRYLAFEEAQNWFFGSYIYSCGGADSTTGTDWCKACRSMERFCQSIEGCSSATLLVVHRSTLVVWQIHRKGLSSGLF